MRASGFLSLFLLTCCSVSGGGRESAAPSEPLSLDQLAIDQPADCVFAANYGSTPVLLATHERNRARGQIRPVGRSFVELTGTSVGRSSDLPNGVQLEGKDLSVSVTPLTVPGVPVGVSGVRRPAVLTAAAADGATVVVEGDWSCVG